MHICGVHRFSPSGEGQLLCAFASKSCEGEPVLGEVEEEGGEGEEVTVGTRVGGGGEGRLGAGVTAGEAVGKPVGKPMGEPVGKPVRAEGAKEGTAGLAVGCWEGPLPSITSA
eukprot:Hpha_TRINITY_DN27211_c0_g1::TRINITY_DN27211_c0_g1_i1::g.140677::m.140677